MTTALLTPSAAAERLGVKPATLAAWRTQRRGPTWRKIGGSVRYGVDDIDAFVAAASRPALPAQPKPVRSILGASA